MALAVSLVVLLGGTLASAAFSPNSGTPVAPAAAAQPAPPTNQPPLPLPTVDPDPCGPGSPPLPICTLPTPTTTPTKPPCTGEGCIPQPGTTTPPPTNPGTGQPGQGEQTEDDCGITDIGACITEAINAFFRGIVTEALNPLLDLLSKTLLTTPMPDSLPRVGELWDNSWQILLVSYGLLVLIAGIIVMGYQTVQTRQSIKETAPRLVVGFLSGALSLWVATKGIEIANALVATIMGGGVDAASAGETLRNLVIGSLNNDGVWISLIGIVLAGILIALLVTYVVRVALTILLIVGAPLALMFHALEQTEGIAYWWWKAYGGCLAIQVGQSLTLITAMKVFLAPGGFTIFGPTMSGLVNLLVAIALLYILFKIPFWVLSSVRGGGGRRGLIGSLVRAFVAYKTFGLLGGGGGKSPKPRPSGGGRDGNSGGNGTGGSTSDPYANARTTANGQYVLPLSGVRRTRPTGKPAPKPGPAPKSSGPQGRQLALPLGDDWPENKPVLGRDGQYRLPLDVQRTTPPPASPTGTDTGGRRTRTAGGKQLELPLDPYRGNRPNRSGQYSLPLDGVRRVPRPASPPPPPSPRPSGHRVAQPELPFDPYKGNRATRGGQYPLPLDGVRRTPAPKPAPAPPPAAPPRPAPRAGQQLRLPLDLPKPAKPPTTPVFSSPPSPPPPAPPPARPSPKPGGKSS
ncbi:hypothetical protein C8D88_10895 [Lentzea atacamensis]|uniref:TrbL/VirB6 plasmid conjugal transfer protein n=1 Tax=Lentzea atacamensis TaxID=531938 RepID=A0A316HWY7_9PSEU|nr:hypothetical protein C8D88_10895 [Lentzea atacamensis]